MDSDNSIIYGLEYQARALAAQTAETEKVCYFIGTLSLKQQTNQIHQIEFNDDDSTVQTKIYQYQSGEIWRLVCSPLDKSVLAVCSVTVTSGTSRAPETAILRLPTTDSNSTNDCLQTVTRLDVTDAGTTVRTTEFHPADSTKAASLTDTHFIHWDIASDAGVRIAQIEASDGKNSSTPFTIGKWNPHQHSNQFTVAIDTKLKTYDVRSRDIAWSIDAAQSVLLRDLDFNPNKMHHIATCGDDGYTKIWDFRHCSKPVYSRCDHSHWIWSIRFNPFHDQLLLTASSDAKVLISSAASVSSENTKLDFSMDDEECRKMLHDGPLQWCEHEDSVYAAEWSPASPWVFASLSYDGRLLISRVERSLKYKIMFN